MAARVLNRTAARAARSKWDLLARSPIAHDCWAAAAPPKSLGMLQGFGTICQFLIETLELEQSAA